MNTHTLSPIALLATLSLGASLPSQTGYAAHVPSNTPGAGACSVVPMGSSRSSTNRQLRTQIIQIVVTAAELGNKARTISNIAFAPCDNGVRSYTRLRIVMAHKKPGALSTTFQNNMFGTASHPTVKVFDDSNYKWPNKAGQWNNLGLFRSFRYDPRVGDLIIEITARNADFTGTNPAMRADTRPTLHAFGFSNTPKTGTLSRMSTKIRVSDGIGYIDSVMQACGPGPLNLKGTGKPVLNGSVDLQITNGSTSTNPTIGVVLLGFTPMRRGLDTSCAILVVPDLIFWAPLTRGVSPTLSFKIPNIANLVGGKVYFQGAHQDQANTKFGYAMTARTIVTIGR